MNPVLQQYYFPPDSYDYSLLNPNLKEPVPNRFKKVESQFILLKAFAAKAFRFM